MSEFLSETEGCDLLARLFRARGYSIARNLLFREYGVEFHIDGWDAKARVGFEFLSSEDDDHDDLNLAEYQTLAAAQQRGELALFIIDEVEPLSAADLAEQANEFLDEVAEAKRSRRFVNAARKKAVMTKRPTAKKSAAGKKKAAAGKTVGKETKTVGKKAAAGKARGVAKSVTKRPAAGARKVGATKVSAKTRSTGTAAGKKASRKKR